MLEAQGLSVAAPGQAAGGGGPFTFAVASCCHRVPGRRVSCWIDLTDGFDSVVLLLSRAELGFGEKRGIRM